MNKFEKRCKIPVLYCGDKEELPEEGPSENEYYARKGTSGECLKKGFGAGMYSERNKNLPNTSIRNIKYVTEVQEENFKSMGVKNLSQLKKEAKKGNFKDTLKAVLLKNGVFDKRAYNSVLLWLYNHGTDEKELPTCYALKI